MENKLPLKIIYTPIKVRNGHHKGKRIMSWTIQRKLYYPGLVIIKTLHYRKRYTSELEGIQFRLHQPYVKTQAYKMQWQGDSCVLTLHLGHSEADTHLVPSTK